MNYNDALIRGARRVLVTQGLLTVLIVIGFGLTRDWRQALAAGYGGMVTLLVTAWLAWRLRRAGQVNDAAAGMGVIYSSWFLRYATVMVLLGMGLGYLQLPALPLLAAFAVTQLGFLASIRHAGST